MQTFSLRFSILQVCFRISPDVAIIKSWWMRKPHTDESDGWGACRRAVAAAKSYYQEAKQVAEKLGWTFLVGEMDGFISRLGTRLFLINQQASFEEIKHTNLFTAEYVEDVMVNEDFSAGASELAEFSPLAALIGEVVSESDAEDPRTQYLLGLKADVAGDQAQALEHFRRANQLLQQERARFFDPRGRGTIVENRPELVRDLGLRFLALGDLESAFEAFESIRSRGLTALATIFEHSNLIESERKWLADLVQLQSMQSALTNRLVETAIAGVEHSKSEAILEQLEELGLQERKHRNRAGSDALVAHLRAASSESPSLGDLRDAAKESNASILLYWVTRTNVLVWAIGPSSMTVKTVFLPEVEVIEKVNAVLGSASKPGSPLEELPAKQLYAYLVAPFADYFSTTHTLLVPQGPLVALPFETLMNTKTGKFLVEDTVVSYAPNATMALRELRGEPVKVESVVAIYDGEIEAATGEIAGLRKLTAIEITAEKSQGLDADRFIDLLSSGGCHHVLLHGYFDRDDALQSRVDLNNHSLPESENSVTAGELLAVDWSAAPLVVFSSCEGAQVDARISNEIHGLSWAPLVGGARQVLLSRWQVQAASNATWMRHFYRHLAADGNTPGMARAAAMREMISSGHRDPYTWAAPQLFGK